MKKIFGSIILLTLIVTFSYGQELKYEKTLDDALALSAKNYKAVFICLNVPMPPLAKLPANLNLADPFPNGLASPEVAAVYRKNFNSYQTLFTDSTGARLRAKYHITRFPAYVFLDPHGQLLYINNQVAPPSPDNFIEAANVVLTRIGSGRTISNYETLYSQNLITTEKLKDYIALREELMITDNAALVEKYTQLLPPEAFNDYNEVLFILKAGPYAYGKAFNLAHTNQKIADSVYKRELLAARTAINNNIIGNTRGEAVKTKNLQMAASAARFARATWGQNAREGGKAYVINIMNYYSAIKDTANFFLNATQFYDAYYMTISADSAKKLQEKQRQTMQPPGANQMAGPPQGAMGFMTAVMAPATVASTLNSAAYSFYTFGTKNPVHLNKAITWVKRAIEFQPMAAFYDTMAHLQYRLNLRDEAILNQTKAIAMAESEMSPSPSTANYKAELAKMKAGSL
jgi:hypothetical protein